MFSCFDNKRKMPENCQFDENETSEFINNGGVSKNTKLCKERAVNHFMNYVKSNLSSKENLATLPNTVNGQFSRFFIVFRRFWSELLLKLVENFKVPYGIMLLFPR
mgnify:CR=1 FL=1